MHTRQGDGENYRGLQESVERDAEARDKEMIAREKAARKSPIFCGAEALLSEKGMP